MQGFTSVYWMIIRIKCQQKNNFCLHIAFSKVRNTALLSIMDHYGRKYEILVASYFHAP